MKKKLYPILWLSMAICLAFCQTARAQYERGFPNLLKYRVLPMAETYDHAILLMAQNDNSVRAPCYIVKQSLEGNNIWLKQLDNTFNLNGLISTRDSGFAVSAVINMHPKDSVTDSVIYSALLKYDKCARLQWAKYLAIDNATMAMNIVEDKKGNLYLLADGINGSFTKNAYKPFSILKFSKDGSLTNSTSFDGELGQLYYSESIDRLILAQSLYLPFNKQDSTKGSTFCRLTELDMNLNSLHQVAIGHAETLPTLPGPVLTRQNEVIALTQTFSVKKSQTGVLFSPMDSSFKLNGANNVLDNDYQHRIAAVSAIVCADSIISSNFYYASQNSTDSLCTSLRIYNSKYQLIKELKQNKYWGQRPNMLLALSGGRFISGISNTKKYSYQSFSSIYLFDHNLNPLLWPSTPPASGYDWACNSTIPVKEIISPDSIVKPIHIMQDTGRTNFGWLYAAVQEPDLKPTDTEAGWHIWPQPAAAGQGINLYTASVLNIMEPIQVHIKDMQGRELFRCMAMPQANKIYHINAVPCTNKGIYIVSIYNSTGSLLTNIKLVIQ